MRNSSNNANNVNTVNNDRSANSVGDVDEDSDNDVVLGIELEGATLGGFPYAKRRRFSECLTSKNSNKSKS